MAMHQYIGARYVPTFYENSLDPTSTEWENNVSYEPLTVVTLPNLHSYISKKFVPDTVGTPASNPEYWLDQGYANAYINALQDQIDDMNDGSIPGSLQNQINTNANDIATINNTTIPGINNSIDDTFDTAYLKPLENKNILIIGDSISTESTNPPNWVTNFKNKLNGIAGTITNHSSGGYTMSALQSDINTIITDASNDIIIIFLGVNDWYTSIPLAPYQFSTVDTSSFNGCLIQTIMKLFDRYTQLGATRYPEVYFVTPIRELWQTPMNSLGYTLDLYRKAIIGLAKISGCGWINGDGALNLSNTISSARKTMYLPDGTHPTAKYSVYLADYILKKLLEGGESSEYGTDGEVIDWSSNFGANVTNGIFKMWACGSGMLKYEISGTATGVTTKQIDLGSCSPTLFAPYTNMFRYLPAAFYNTTLGDNGGATLFISANKLYLGLNAAPGASSNIQFMANGVVHSRCLQADDVNLF